MHAPIAGPGEATFDTRAAPLVLAGFLGGPADAAPAPAAAAEAERMGLRIEIDVPSTQALGRVRVDASRVRQVLINLLSNAVKFSDGGAIRVEASRDHGGMVRVSVPDQGPPPPRPSRLHLRALHAAGPADHAGPWRRRPRPRYLTRNRHEPGRRDRRRSRQRRRRPVPVHLAGRRRAGRPPPPSARPLRALRRSRPGAVRRSSRDLRPSGSRCPRSRSSWSPGTIAQASASSRATRATRATRCAAVATRRSRSPTPRHGAGRPCSCSSGTFKGQRPCRWRAPCGPIRNAPPQEAPCCRPTSASSPSARPRARSTRCSAIRSALTTSPCSSTGTTSRPARGNRRVSRGARPRAGAPALAGS
ncbi:Histidine kinase-, DNA gyrase B-, and HSP90-like ATPase [Rubrimonas cliftonensis]|uniref:histidine kinase n=1 Tax=Rubrimonas cliftonensis TaxID=89524 RepID=A0A1H4AUI4_9RHOB|nr:Histidine kinase-, DNA gyrase B-, and HSP90-like ATPase [Rubrimonas cliftonensis]